MKSKKVDPWVVAETDHFYGRFPSKARAILVLRALRLDGRARPDVQRVPVRPRAGKKTIFVYEYTPPASSSRQSKVYIGTDPAMRAIGFDRVLDDPANAPGASIGDEECEECCGTGKQPAYCSSCAKPLTAGNVARAIGYDVDFLGLCVDCYMEEHPHAESE